MGDRGVEGAADGANELIKSNTRGLVCGFEEKCPKIYGQHDSRAARAAPGPKELINPNFRSPLSRSPEK